MSQEKLVEAKRKSIGFALVITFVFAGSLCAAAWRSEGSLAAQRIIVDLVMPLGLAWLGSLFAAIQFWKLKQSGGASSCALIFIAISVLFSPLVNRELMCQVEGPVPAISPLDPSSPSYRAVVVLGGGAWLGRDGQAQLNGNGQRVATAAQLWHAGKVAAIICTGEDNIIPGPIPSDSAEQAKCDLWNPARVGIDLLESLGVPSDRLYRIGGINTSNEMKQLKSFLENPPTTFPVEGEIGLITSAFHMNRALRLARGEGLCLIPIPVAYQTGLSEPIAVGDLVPNVSAGEQFRTAIKECLAWLVGR